MNGKNAFLKILHVSTLTLALGCDVFGQQCLARNREANYSDFDEKAFENMVLSDKCDEAFRFIWHRVATGEVRPTEILENYIENGIIILPNLKNYNMSSAKVSLMLQMKVFGRSSRGRDDRLMHRLSSPEITQPEGKKVGACLAASKGSGEAVQECIESAETVGVIDDFMNFYFYADKAMDNAVTVQCGRN
ncbi:hypothetical protein ACFX5Q_07625 [Mesorhizobium sp. IMUNJ 23033]|uniref:hypothetical protein n=1 Tax=Mesorhizobium sp. IMUNJ 23033 TaxID=3378039 RepID=UPI00384CB7D6